MKQTKNRTLILRLLADNLSDCGGCPPHSANNLHWALHHNGFAEWYAEQDGEPPPKHKPPSIQQIHRTLKDLARQGLIVCEHRIDDPIDHGLPQKVAYWQLADKVEFNALVQACNELYQKTKRAKFGSPFFGAVFDQGLPPDEVDTLKTEIKALMQLTHPDKAHGLEAQFKQLQQCKQWIKDGIDAPKLSNSITNRNN